MIPEFTQFRIYLKNFEVNLEEAISSAKIIAEENKKLKEELKLLKEEIDKYKKELESLKTEKANQ
jgi:predicted RNase H-like nuclease (RuvC/YqgF family)